MGEVEVHTKEILKALDPTILTFTGKNRHSKLDTTSVAKSLNLDYEEEAIPTSLLAPLSEINQMVLLATTGQFSQRQKGGGTRNLSSSRPSTPSSHLLSTPSSSFSSSFSSSSSSLLSSPS